VGFANQTTHNPRERATSDVLANASARNTISSIGMISIMDGIPYWGEGAVRTVPNGLDRKTQLEQNIVRRQHRDDTRLELTRCNINVEQTESEEYVTNQSLG
jgi:hypothetical protein